MALNYMLIERAKQAISVAQNHFNMASTSEEIDKAIDELNCAEARHKNLYLALRGKESPGDEKE
jgi:hypothetical protein